MQQYQYKISEGDPINPFDLCLLLFLLGLLTIVFVRVVS